MPSLTHTAELTSALRIAVMRTARRLRNERADSTLSIGSLAALGTLERVGPLTPSELAEHEHVQPPSMTRMLANLEAAGMVERAPHPTDGRQVVVTPTVQARAMLKADRKRRDEWLAVRLAGLTREERGTLEAATEILDRISRS
jgi:DNA-binding MarR family transcriptional regulator